MEKSRFPPQRFNSDFRFSGDISLRERLLLDYADNLCTHPSLWQVGVDYLDHCPTLGRHHLHEYISRIHPTTLEKANKIISIAQQRNMKDVGKFILTAFIHTFCTPFRKRIFYLSLALSEILFWARFI